MNDVNRVVVWFSAGVTSAVAAKLAIEQYRGQYPIVVAQCDTGSEHEDNYRFTRDVANWLGVEIVMLRSEKYRDTFDVYRKTGWLVGPAGARCTLELKKKVRQKFEDVAGDLQVFGYDATEKARARRFQENNPLVRMVAPLIERGLTKDECRQILAAHGIAEPVTYSLGFNNANCLARGCVKGGMGYWNHIRRVLPDVFDRMAVMEREVGVAILKNADGPIFLDELDPNAGNYNTEPVFQCGLFCGQYMEAAR